MSKITLATIKRFISANRAQLQISCRSRFDGMTDGMESCRDQSFRPAVAPNLEGKPFRSTDRDNRLGIEGAWFVFESRDFFRAYDEGNLQGFRISNCCADFVLAIPKGPGKSVESDQQPATVSPALPPLVEGASNPGGRDRSPGPIYQLRLDMGGRIAA